MGISRPPVREALKLLEGDGLIVRKPNHGAFVTRITKKDAWEIYSLKSVLYGMATELAFSHITEENITQWERIVGQMEKCADAEPPDILEYQRLHQSFHDLMIHIADHGRLKKVSEMLHNQVKHFSSRSLIQKGHLEESLLYHKKILASIKQGDAQLTVKLTKDHISMALEYLEDVPVEEGDAGAYGREAETCCNGIGFLACFFVDRLFLLTWHEKKEVGNEESYFGMCDPFICGNVSGAGRRNGRIG